MSKVSKKFNKLAVPALVTEMSDKVDGFDVAVPFAQGVDIGEMTVGDDDPLFVTVEVMSPQISANKRHWTEDSLFEIAEQINKIRPNAYQGHIKEEDRAFSSPNPQTIWLGATVKRTKGALRLFAKGYVLPYADKLKTYLRSSKAAGKSVGVSVYGKAHQAWNNAKQAYDIRGFLLESIDWARSGSEGVKGTGYLELTSEMEGENSMDRLEVISTVTIDELKANNPDIVKEMQTDKNEVIGTATIEEIKTGNPTIVKEMQDEANATAEKNNGGKAGVYAIREMSEVNQKLGTDKGKAVEVISEMQTDLGVANGKLTDQFVESALSEKIKNTDIASFTKKLVIAEMEKTDVTGDDLSRQRFGGFSRGEIKAKKAIDAVLSSPEAKTLISEMGRSTVIKPVIDNRNKPDKRQFTVIK